MGTVAPETDLDAVQLPMSVQAALSPETAQLERQRKLDALSQWAVDRRQDAIDGRRDSGIETIWLRYEEAYVGIDDVNRGQVGAPTWTKSPIMGGPLMVTTRKESSTKQESDEEIASIYVRATARYVDAGTAKISEIILSPDEKSFGLSATPIASELAESKEPLRGPDGTILERDAKPHEQPATQSAALMSPQNILQEPPQNPATMGQGPGMPLTPEDLAEEKQGKAEQQAKRAERRIHDQFVESKYNSEARKFLFDAARIGVGVMKGPYAVLKNAKKFQRKELKDANGKTKAYYELVIEEKVVPGVKRISPWDFFPDRHCGEDIHNGAQVWERDYVIEQELARLKKQEAQGYLPDQIEACIRQGALRTVATADKKAQDELLKGESRQRFEIWYGQVKMAREDLLILNRIEEEAYSEDELADERFLKESVNVIITLVNDRVIKAESTPLGSGEFHYDTVSWQRRENSWSGVGIGEQLDGPQRIINGATRSMLSNANKSAGSQHVVDTDLIEPVDNEWSVYGDKFWRRKKGGTGILDDVRQAFVSIQVPNVTPQLMTVIEYGFRLAEDVSNIPLISQGQSGPQQPKTLGGLELQDNNANQLLRHIASVYDDGVTTNLVPRFYEWNMLDPDIPENEKGDFQCHTQGSSALVERHVQNQVIGQIGNIVKDPAFGADPRKWFKNFLKGQRLNPDDHTYSKEQLAKIDSQPPPPPPQVMAAQITAQAREAQSQRDHEYRMAELQITREIELLKMANQRNISLDNIKESLAKTTMELKTQIDLATMDTQKKTAQVANAPAEPPGRAPNGKAFTQ